RVIEYQAEPIVVIPTESLKLAEHFVILLEYPGLPAKQVNQTVVERSGQRDDPKDHAVAPRPKCRPEIVPPPHGPIRHGGEVALVVDLRQRVGDYVVGGENPQDDRLGLDPSRVRSGHKQFLHAAIARDGEVVDPEGSLDFRVRPCHSLKLDPDRLIVVDPAP